MKHDLDSEGLPLHCPPCGHFGVMSPPSDIDTTFDFRSDAPLGRDSDAFSPGLSRRHKLLWSKPLPNGAGV